MSPNQDHAPRFRPFRLSLAELAVIVLAFALFNARLYVAMKPLNATFHDPTSVARNGGETALVWHHSIWIDLFGVRVAIHNPLILMMLLNLIFLGVVASMLFLVKWSRYLAASRHANRMESVPAR